jgi:epsilon-lactone hydrolase
VVDAWLRAGHAVATRQGGLRGCPADPGEGRAAAADYWRLIRTLARGGAEVLVPAYPLAPGSTVDDVLPALVEVVRSGAEEGRPLPVVLMGDSAGGALALATARLVQDRVPHLASIVCLCPWLDAALGEAEVSALEPSDPMLAESGLRAAGRWWAGMRSTDDPLVSPMWADLDDLPSIELYIADRDILRPAVDRLVARADSQRVEISVHEFPQLFHVWMTRRIPEGRRTRRALAQCVQRRATGHPTG